MTTPARAFVTSGAAGLAAAAAVAVLIREVQALAPGNPERGVALTLALFAVLAIAALGALAARRRADLAPADLGLAAALTAAVLSAGSYLFWASASILYRADILIWSESPFVNDILKLRVGAPLYGAPADLSSFFYTPGSQLLTWALAAMAGHGSSIPAYRVVQVGYAALAALLAARATWRVLDLSGIDAPGGPRVFGALSTVLLFLCATNATTNPFSHLLHNDALSLVVSAAAYLLLVEYAATRRSWLIAAMAVLPAVGFLVKQSLGIWAPLFGMYLLVCDRPRSMARVLAFGAGGAALLAAVYGVSRALWGADFQYWVVTAMGNHPVSALRAVQHVLDAWAFFAAGLVGGAVTLSGRGPGRLFGVWMVWLALLAIEAYTSGIAWMLNHMGPGSLLAGIWLCAAAARLWPRGSSRAPAAWFEAGVAAAVLVLALQGLGAVRIPVPSLSAAHERYAAAIEREFEGEDASRVLLDAGTWVYLRPRVVMRDRSAPVGELGNNQVGDFTGMLGRLQARHYRRILVRDLDTPELAYDHVLWARSSGIRAALLANYRVVRTIPGITERDGWSSPWTHPLSVLEPRAVNDTTEAVR